MSSIVPGFEYDIFISYRQKDNRSDRWVTSFVKALREELDATFKEEVSIYFDANAHDGLLETHDVEGSLKEKIKCLIFIPIVSQTYCDPKSFAWQKEFLAFIDFAKGDQLGLDLKLGNGNVAKRVLPIKIHDIDTNDKKLFEDVTGGVMRSVDFIYQEPGVNRPLRITEENPANNQNKTYYRNQINKVALSLKDLIIAMTRPSAPKHPGEELSAHKENVNSIVVLPFINMSSDHEQEYFCDGITEEVINTLTALRDLKVIARTTAFSFKNKSYDIDEIARRVNVNFVLEGSIRKAAEKIRLNVNVIDVKSGEHIWAVKFDRELRDIFLIQEEIANSISQQLKILTLEKFPRPQTNSMEAFNFYLMGRYVAAKGDADWGRQSSELFRKAIEKDPKFAAAHAAISLSAWVQTLEGITGVDNLIGRHALLAIQYDGRNADAHAALGISLYYNDWKWRDAEAEFRVALGLNPSSILTLHHFATLLDNLGRGNEALVLLNQGLAIDPLNTVINQSVGYCYFTMHQFEQSKIFSEAALRIEPSHFLAKIVLVFALIELREIKAALELLATMPADNLFVRTCLVKTYMAKGDVSSARHLMQESLPNGHAYPSSIAWMLIALGEHDEAFRWLNHAVDQKDIQVLSLPVFTWWDPIRNDKRFTEILERTGLIAYVHPARIP